MKNKDKYEKPIEINIEHKNEASKVIKYICCGLLAYGGARD